MGNWWIRKKLRYVTGPFTDEQINRQIRLNVVTSTDEVSGDHVHWQYLRSSLFWVRREAPIRAGGSAGPTPGHKGVKETPLSAGSIDFTSAQDKLVIIDCDEGSGTGFLLMMEDGVFLVTNEHVIRSVSVPRCRLLNGHLLQLGAFSVATDRDLARFELRNSDGYSSFTSNTALPSIGDKIIVYGNSLGQGVVTESRGTIRGVGPTQLETAVDIVHGNSGSPILNQAGEVLGVATYVVTTSRDEDWTLKKTRYDGTPRRFALRFTDVQWKPIDHASYMIRVKNFNEFEAFWDILISYLSFDSQEGSEHPELYDEVDAKQVFQDKEGFIRAWRTLTQAYVNYVHANGTDKAIRVMLKTIRQVLEELVLYLAPDWEVPQIMNRYSNGEHGCVVCYRERVQYLLNATEQRIRSY